MLYQVASEDYYQLRIYLPYVSFDLQRITIGKSLQSSYMFTAHLVPNTFECMRARFSSRTIARDKPVRVLSRVRCAMSGKSEKSRPRESGSDRASRAV